MAAAAGLVLGCRVEEHSTVWGKEALPPAPQALAESHTLSERVSSSVKGMTRGPDCRASEPACHTQSCPLPSPHGQAAPDLTAFVTG